MVGRAVSHTGIFLVRLQSGMKRAFDHVVVPAKQTLVGVQREWHTRKPGAYLVRDRDGKFLLVSQRLPLIAAWVNAMARDAGERVSVPALHHTATASHRTGGYTKNKWAVDFCPLEEVGSRFEGTRRSFETALILGQPECYQLA